jgi:hypothetical protein
MNNCILKNRHFHSSHAQFCRVYGNRSPLSALTMCVMPNAPAMAVLPSSQSVLEAIHDFFPRPRIIVRAFVRRSTHLKTILLAVCFSLHS